MAKDKVAKEKKTSIGGQALIEGILMRGPDRTAIVVRKSDGELEIKEDNVGSASHAKIWTLPFLRGPVAFWDSMKYGMSALTYSAEFFETEDEKEPGSFEKWVEKKIGTKKFEKIMLSLAVVMGIALPVALFILLPTLIAGLFGDGMHYMLRNLVEGGIRIVIFVAFVWSTSLIKDIHRTYMYHGAEHKSIACYEKGLPLTVENVSQCCRFHPRCGTSFLFVVMIVSILVFSLVHWSNPLIRMLLRLLLLPVVAAISYEINRFAGRHDNILTKMLRAPGMMMQRITTAEPDEQMMQVAIEALIRVIPDSEDKDRW